MPLSGQFLTFEEKYLHGGGSKGMASLSRVVPAPIDDGTRDEIQRVAREVFRQLDCKGVVRIDFMFDRATEKLYITEINTIPGSLAFYLWEAGGMKYSALIDRMVAYARKAHAEKNANSFAFRSDILSKAQLGGAKGAKGAKGGKLGGGKLG